jgi:hypothetical protein
MLFSVFYVNLLLWLAAAQNGTVVPEVIPNSLLPSLADLGVTSAQLYSGVYREFYLTVVLKIFNLCFADSKG